MPTPSTPDTPTTTAAQRPRARRPLRGSPEARERRRRLMWYGLWFVSTVLAVHALIGEKGYLASLQAAQDIARAEAQVAALRAENASLADEARRLRSDPAMLEAVARGELGLIRPGEILIRLRDRPKD